MAFTIKFMAQTAKGGVRYPMFKGVGEDKKLSENR